VLALSTVFNSLSAIQGNKKGLASESFAVACSVVLCCVDYRCPFNTFTHRSWCVTCHDLSVAQYFK
jgi:hypothetical protein